MVLENGNPVADVGIHIKNHFDPGGFTEGEHIEVDIHFTASMTGVYRMDLFRLGSNEIFATVLDDTLGEGDQKVTVPDSLLSNGVYVYQITTPTEATAENNFLINKPDSTLGYTEPLTSTNTQGEFEIDADYLPIDKVFSREGNEQFEVTDSLQIIVVREENIVARKFIKVSENEDENFVEISVD